MNMIIEDVVFRANYLIMKWRQAEQEQEQGQVCGGSTFFRLHSAAQSALIRIISAAAQLGEVRRETNRGVAGRSHC